MKRGLTIILFAALLLTGCQSTNTPENTVTAGSTQKTNAVTESEEEKIDPAHILELPDTDWGGREFRVLGFEGDYPQWTTFEIAVDGLNGEIVNDAVYHRNVALEDKYNVQIVEDKYHTTGSITKDNNANVLIQAIQSGEDRYELAFVTLSRLGGLARDGMLYDLNTVGNIDFSKAWWNETINDSLSLCNKLFFTSSDFSLRDKSRSTLMLYNKDLLMRLNLDDPTAMVRDGTWTIDVMNQWIEVASIDQNGDGKTDTNDMFGLAVDAADAVNVFTTGCDVQKIIKDNNGIPIFNVNNEHTANVLDKILPMFTNRNYTVEPMTWKGDVPGDIWYIGYDMFYAGHVLFSTIFLHQLSDMSEKCEEDYRILPVPKYDETQNAYYSIVNNYGMMFAIPVSCQDPEFSGFMLEALSAASTDTSLKAYYEISCKTKYTYDEGSAKMLDLVFDGMRYDLAAIYNINGMSNIFESLIDKPNQNIASRYAAVEKSAKKDLDTLVADLTK